MNKNVLITGASGFIGTHLIRFLLQKNSLYTTNFIGPLSYQAFSFLKLL
ncbi:NAD-dependent epimerase/dehydratase family protein, partial [Acinetobacter baumannii]